MTYSNSEHGLAQHKNALIMFNYGYGNVFMTLPILAALERKCSQLRYHCMDHRLLHNERLLDQAGVSHIEGFVKSSWRRFLPQDRSALFNYLSNNNITWLINLRLEAPDFDQHYFSFKKEAIRRGITCWDLHDFGLSSEVSKLADKMRKMFLRRGLPINDVSDHWLQNAFSSGNGENNSNFNIAVYLGASRPSKRWSIDNWAQLIRQVLSESDVNLYLFSGIELDEKQYSQHILHDIKPYLNGHSEYIVDQPLDTVLANLAKANLIITHDTFVSHFAAACSIPEIVLFPATDSRIWQPVTSSPFVAVQSDEAMKCPEMKIDGTCKRYYASCDKQCCLGIQWQDVMNHVRHFMNGNIRK